MQKIECSYCQKVYTPKPKDNCNSCASDSSCQTAKCPYCGYPAVESLKSGEVENNTLMSFFKGLLTWKKSYQN